jgi:hypothetical protein
MLIYHDGKKQEVSAVAADLLRHGCSTDNVFAYIRSAVFARERYEKGTPGGLGGKFKPTKHKLFPSNKDAELTPIAQSLGKADVGFRKAASDEYEEKGRDEEAKILRSTKTPYYVVGDEVYAAVPWKKSITVHPMVDQGAATAAGPEPYEPDIKHPWEIHLTSNGRDVRIKVPTGSPHYDTVSDLYLHSANNGIDHGNGLVLKKKHVDVLQRLAASTPGNAVLRTGQLGHPPNHDNYTNWHAISDNATDESIKMLSARMKHGLFVESPNHYDNPDELNRTPGWYPFSRHQFREHGLKFPDSVRTDMVDTFHDHETMNRYLRNTGMSRDGQ